MFNGFSWGLQCGGMEWRRDASNYNVHNTARIQDPLDLALKISTSLILRSSAEAVLKGLDSVKAPFEFFPEET